MVTKLVICYDVQEKECFEVDRQLYDFLENFRQIDQQKDSCAHYCCAFTMNLHLETVLKGQTQQNYRHQIAEDLLSIGSITLCQFIRSQIKILLLCSFQEFRFHIINLDDLGGCNTFFKDLDKFILIFVEMMNNFGLNEPQKHENRYIDSPYKEDDDDYSLLVGCDKEDGGNQDDTVFVYQQDVVPYYEDLLVILY